MKNFFDEDIQNQYQKLLDNAIDTSHVQEPGFNKLLNFISERKPKSLYRFRSCKERTLDEFYRDLISFGVASKMNDDFDSLMYFDKYKVKDSIKSLCDSVFGQDADGIRNMASYISSRHPNSKVAQEISRSI